jgi:hypothetical protein
VDISSATSFTRSVTIRKTLCGEDRISGTPFKEPGFVQRPSIDNGLLNPHEKVKTIKRFLKTTFALWVAWVPEISYPFSEISMKAS